MRFQLYIPPTVQMYLNIRFVFIRDLLQNNRWRCCRRRSRRQINRNTLHWKFLQDRKWKSEKKEAKKKSLVEREQQKEEKKTHNNELEFHFDWIVPNNSQCFSRIAY